MSGGRAGMVPGEPLRRHLLAANSHDRASFTGSLLSSTLVTLPSGDLPCRGSERTTPGRPRRVIEWLSGKVRMGFDPKIDRGGFLVYNAGTCDEETG
jgi:hypothetical protein